MLMTEPNTRLRAVRRGLHMSQAELARAVRLAGERAGEPNPCSATTVQRWEQGAEPRGAYLRALELATGQPAENLGFRADERYGLDTEALGMAAETSLETEPWSQATPLNGIWVSRYEYESSGRGAWFTSSHYALVIQRGARMQVRSLPDTAPGRLLMDLTVNGQAVTGNWTEETNAGGYYQGAVYHGAIQMLLEPSGRKMTGKWAGFGRDFDVNTGPWSLELVTHDTSLEAQEKYNRPVKQEAS
jgi:transcriptional regulator with XRE-family HTH domain